jgi:uncharacterized protein (DUF58 family)
MSEATAKRAPIDPEAARRIAALTLEIRRAALGLLSGKHRSPHRGASVVFVEHREYRPGDDPRLIDWRAYARNDRHVIKRFEQEAQLSCTLLLDASRSMDFRGEREPRSKLEHAAGLLAGIALVLRKQADAVGLLRFAAEVERTLPARASIAHVDRVLAALGLPATAAAGTDLRGALESTVDRAGRRGLVVIASDLIAPDAALAPIAQLVGHGHEVWLLHVLSREELALSADGAARYVGLEGEPDVDADPSLVRTAYRTEVDAFVARMRAAATQRGARYRLTCTDEPIEAPLAELLLHGRRTRWA